MEIVDYSAGARIQAREYEEIVLQCIVRNAKPAADIVWFKRNQEIKLGNNIYIYYLLSSLFMDPADAVSSSCIVYIYTFLHPLACMCHKRDGYKWILVH